MEPTEQLQIGRRALESVAGYELLEDLVWNEQLRQWVLHLQLSIDAGPTKSIPKVTNWYILISPSYPWGSILVFPDNKGGITQTFPHQHNNRPSKNHPWREGNLCVRTSNRYLDRRGYDVEPYGAAERLAWFVNRTIEWLEAASGNELTKPGDPFELPDFSERKSSIFAFSEDASSLDLWREIEIRSGILVMKQLRSSPQILLVKEFLSAKGASLHRLAWGKRLETEKFTEVH